MKLCREDMDTLSSMYHVDRVQLDGFLKQMLLMMDALELNYRRNFIDLSNQVRDLGSKVDRLLEELGVNSPTQEEDQ
jgi:hypothetical protein